MSPEKENDHSSDKLDSTDSLKGKEVSSWLLNLMSNRVLSLSPHSRINLTMPPIASSIWRRIGHLSPQAIRLPILQRTSIPILNKAPSFSMVWRRLLDLPLLRRRQKRTSEFIQASHSYIGGQWSANIYMSPDEALSNEYSQGIAMIGDEQLAIEPFEPRIGQNVQRVPLVAESQSVDAADDFYPTLVDDMPTRPADIAREPHQAERAEKSIYPSSDIQSHEQMISKSWPADDSKPSLLPIDRTTAPEPEQYNQVQESDLEDVKYTEDIQPGPSLKPQPEYKSPDITGISSSPSTEPDLEYVGRMLPRFNEQLQPAFSSEGLGSVQLPITKEPVVSSGKIVKPSIATRLSTPLVQSLPVLQRLYFKTRDKAVELSSKVMQLPYTVGNLGAKKATTLEKEPTPRLDSYEPSNSQPVEENLAYPSPDRGVPAESETITSRYQPIEQPVVIEGVDKSAPDMLSSGAEKHDANLAVPSNNLISHRVLEIQKTGKSQIPLSPLTPLIEPRVERFQTKKSDEDLKIIPQGIEAVTSRVLPAGKADVPAEFPAEKPEILPSSVGIPLTTELHREIQPESVGDIEIATSPVLKFFKPARDVRVERSVSHDIMRREVEKPVSALPEKIYRSLELLLTSPVKSGAVLNARGIEGVTTRAFEGRMDYLSQTAIGPESSFEGYSEAVSPKQSFTQIGRYPEVVSPELPHAQTRRYSESMPTELPIAQTMKPAEAMPPELSLIQTRSYSEAMSPELPIVQTRRYSEVTLPETSVAQTKSYTEPVSPEPVFVSARSRTEPALPEPEIVSKKSHTDEISLAAARTEGVAEQAEATTEEEAALDLDAVARDVYKILKRRLYRERERAFGLS